MKLLWIVLIFSA